MPQWFRRVWYLLNRRRLERELVQEMDEHRSAMRDPARFGDTYRLLEQSRDAWGWNWLDDALQDLAVGFRTLRKSPSFAVTATLILTFGIGLNLTLFQMVQVGILRPPAIKDAHAWVRFLRAAPNSTTSTVPYPLTQFVKDNNAGSLTAVILEYQAGLAWGRNAEEQIDASFVSSNWFDETGYGAAHGRVLNELMDHPDAPPVVVLSYSFWQHRLGSDPDIVGKTIHIDRKPVTVAGVAAAALPGLDFNVPDVFLPIRQREYLYPQSALLRSWDDEAVDMYGKLAPGISASAAREALRSTMQAAAAGHPQIAKDEWLEPLLATENFMRAGERQGVLAVLSLIGALTTLVLVVAAANLGNLVMSRATGRVRELGVRMALGARRMRIVRQLVIESVPLVALGTAGSLGFAWAVASLIAAVAGFPGYMDFSIQWPSVIVALLFAAAALVVVGLLPAWKIAQQHLIDALKDGGQAVSRTLDRTLLRRVMIVSQVAGSCLLLIVAGMMVRTVQRAMASSAGFDYQRAAVLAMPLGRYGMPVDAQRSYWYQVKERLLANPEVEQAAIVTAAPLGGRVNETNYDATPGLRTMTQSVDPEYFATMQIRLVSGRNFGANEPDVVIVSRRLALEMYGSLDVLGREFPVASLDRSGPERATTLSTIVGIAADAHSIKVDANDVAELYRPLRPADYAAVELVARARSDAGRLPPILREAAMMDPRVIPTARVMRDDFDRRMQGPRIASAIAGGVGILTLALACLGIFGVVSYGVALRTKEIGIRVALGAQHPALLRSIVRQVLSPVGVGVAIGLLLAIPAGLALGSEPFYLEHADPVAFAAALAVFAAAGAVAALWPAYQVLKQNPVDSLRHS